MQVTAAYAKAKFPELLKAVEKSEFSQYEGLLEV